MQLNELTPNKNIRLAGITVKWLKKKQLHDPRYEKHLKIKYLNFGPVSVTSNHPFLQHQIQHHTHLPK